MSKKAVSYVILVIFSENNVFIFVIFFFIYFFSIWKVLFVNSLDIPRFLKKNICISMRGVFLLIINCSRNFEYNNINLSTLSFWKENPHSYCCKFTSHVQHYIKQYKLNRGKILSVIILFIYLYFKSTYIHITHMHSS